LSNNVIEDERVWGATQWGFGYVSPADVPPDGIPAKSHTDGICLNSSVWLDGVQILDNGKVIHPDLKLLAEALIV
jgi:2,5-dihydroxypyridine 5,6-dioxygenase